jgi:hypothetical protein
MITCRVCRRVATESLTSGWCFDCHNSAAIRGKIADKQSPLSSDEQAVYITKYIRSLAKRIKRGAETAYCECFTVGQYRSRGSQCQSFGDYEYQGRRVCHAHKRRLSEGYTYDFVDEPDVQQDREQAYKLLAAAFEAAPDNGLREILARAIYDARNSKRQGAGAQAEEPGAGAEQRDDRQADLFEWAATRGGPA